MQIHRLSVAGHAWQHGSFVAAAGLGAAGDEEEGKDTADALTAVQTKHVMSSHLATRTSKTK